MLTQAEADALIAMEKQVDKSVVYINFPFPGSTETIVVLSTDGRHRFQLDLEKGRRNPKWKIQLRQDRDILIRIDMAGPPHPNPASAPYEDLIPWASRRVPCPHMQRYVEGYDDNWALPLPPSFTNPDDIARTWEHFLEYCNVTWAPPLQWRGL